MKIKIFLSFTVTLFVLSVFFLGLSTNNKYETTNLLGNKIESFEVNSLNDNSQIKSSLFSQNNYTLINFWASWCAPCRIEHKFLLLLKNNSQVKILGINFKDKKNKAIYFLKKLDNPYHYLAEDTDGRVSIKLGIYGIPESILIDKDLKIIKKYVGPLNEQDYKEILKITNSL